MLRLRNADVPAPSSRKNSVKELSDLEVEEALQEIKEKGGSGKLLSKEDQEELSEMKELSKRAILRSHQGSFDASTAGLVLEQCPITGNAKFDVNTRHLHHYVGSREDEEARTKSVHFRKS